MSSDRVTATAVVQVTLSISITDSWGSDCPISQVHKQAEESALGALWRLGDLLKQNRVKIVGAPTVATITFKEVR